MDGLQKDLKRHYDHGFNDALYHATDFLKATAKDLEMFEKSEEDAELLRNMADVILEDLKDTTTD